MSSLIFLSHASEDKTYVEAVRARLDTAVVFHDINSIEPGSKTVEAMKEGVKDSKIFVLFHSRASKKVWVDFEKDLAEVQAIKRKDLKILVVPLGGETYASLPDWMKAYMTTTESFTVRDVARQIVLLTLIPEAATPDNRNPFPGREDLERKIILAVQQAPAKTGKILKVLVLTGLEGMGKATVAKKIKAEAFRGMRAGGPTFDLPDAAGAIDLYLRLREDLANGLTKTETETQIAAFSVLSAEKQADLVLKGLEHWVDLNQVVTIRSRWGFRERNNSIVGWLEAIFDSISKVSNCRILLLSERRLPPEKLLAFPNVAQFELEQLSDATIEYVLGLYIEPRYQDPIRLTDVAAEVRGHPATAKHVAYLVNSGQTLDTIYNVPSPIYAFHDKTLDAIFSSDKLTEFQLKLLELLSWLPSLSVEIISEIFDGVAKAQIVKDLHELNQYSLINQVAGGSYAVAAVVASRFRRGRSPDQLSLFKKATSLLRDKLANDNLNIDEIDSLLVGVVSLQSEVPEILGKMITASTLLRAVEIQYGLGSGSTTAKETAHFKTAFELSRLSLTMKGSSETLENIQFFGADAYVRVGGYPEEIIRSMYKRGFNSVYYVEGSYLFHVKREPEEAAKKLKSALKSRQFKIRSVRLLTRIYLRSGDFSGALATLEMIPEDRLMRDTGLLVLKVKALRGNRSHASAATLERAIKHENDYGDLAILRAGGALKEFNFKLAQEYIALAEQAPKVNKATLQYLKCAVAIERGDLSLLPATVDLAKAASRVDDAYQLQARAAIVAGDWKEAEDFLALIKRKEYFDLSLTLRMLEAKKLDSIVSGDAVALQQLEQDKEVVLANLARSVELTRF